MKQKSVNKKTTYASPYVKVVKIKVEKGFALSSPTDPTIDQRQNFNYKLLKVVDGGKAW